MLVKIEKVISRSFIAIVTLAVLLVGGVYAWAVTGPRDLSAYIPEIEDSIDEMLGEAEIDISKAELSWGGLDELLKVEAFDAKVKAEGAEVVSIKKISLDFDLLAIITGRLIPRKIVIHDSEISLPIEGIDSGEDSGELDISALKTIGIRNSKIKIASLGKDIEIKNADLSLKEDVGEYRADIRIGESEEIFVMGHLQLDDEDFAVTAQATDVALAEILPVVGVNLTAGVKIDLQAEDGKVESLNVNVSDLSGHVAREELRSELQLVSGEIDLDYELASSRLMVNDSRLEFEDGTQLALTGEVLDFTQPNLAINAGVRNLDILNLHKYWPKGMGDNAIEWIDGHITKGKISSAVARVTIAPEMFKDGKLLPEAVSLKFDFQDMAASYKAGLPPVTNGSGQAVMDANSVTFNIASAKLGNSKIGSGKIKISDIGTDVGYEQLSVAGKVAGSVKDLAGFYEKLAKGKKYFRQADVVSGTVESDLKLKLPLDKNLKLAAVSLDLSARVKDAEINKFMGEMTIKRAAMKITLDDIKTVVKGDFVAYPNVNSDDVKIHTMPIAFDLLIKNGKEELDIVADLESAEISVPALGIYKTAKQPARLSARKTLEGDVSMFERLDFESEALKFNAVGFGGFSEIDSLNFSNLEFAGSRLRGDLKRIGAGYLANLRAKKFNLAPLLDYLDQDESEEKPDTNFSVSLAADELLLKNGQTLHDVKIDLSCKAGECEDFNLSSSEGQAVTTKSSAKLSSTNAEKFLKGFDLYEYLIGGEAALNASKSAGVYTGSLTVRDFNIVKGKFLPQILTIGSLTGIADTLQGNGISFKKLTSDFTKKEGRIDIKNLKMYGSAIGLTANGWVDTDKNQIEISGSVIPAYTANTILGKIPVLGELIIGDEGIFAISYKITGSVEKPDVSVNPLSMLAPGVIKNVFKD